MARQATKQEVWAAVDKGASHKLLDVPLTWLEVDDHGQVIIVEKDDIKKPPKFSEDPKAEQRWLSYVQKTWREGK